WQLLPLGSLRVS
ncbi:methyl-accepting chemotaxis domain protein, partial [Vibrio harveyi]